MTRLNRRALIGTALAAAIIPALPDYATGTPALSASLTRRCAAMREALAAFERASVEFQRFCDEMTSELEDEEFWAWYSAQPSHVAFKAAQHKAQAAVEAVFMTRPETDADDDAIVAAFDAYVPVADSAFAVQCARDLFTPLSHVPAKSRKAYRAIREYLLTDPDEMFEKCNLPAFAIAKRNERKPLAT